MKQPIMLEPWLKALHWDDLANIHLDVCYCRHCFIQTVNEKIASQMVTSIEDLDRLAKVDELLNAAAARLEGAKNILFDFCYERSSEQETDS